MSGPGIASANREKAVPGRSTGNQHRMGPHIVDQPIVVEMDLFGQSDVRLQTRWSDERYQIDDFIWGSQNLANCRSPA